MGKVPRSVRVTVGRCVDGGIRSFGKGGARVWQHASRLWYTFRPDALRHKPVPILVQTDTFLTSSSRAQLFPGRPDFLRYRVQPRHTGHAPGTQPN
eukprot:gene6346-biopygen5873